MAVGHRRVAPRSLGRHRRGFVPRRRRDHYRRAAVAIRYRRRRFRLSSQSAATPTRKAMPTFPTARAAVMTVTKRAPLSALKSLAPKASGVHALEHGRQSPELADQLHTNAAASAGVPPPVSTACVAIKFL